MRRPGQVLSRFALLEHAWDYDYENRSNVVDSYVRFLRRKIDKPFGTDSIETVRGAGYRLREGGDEADPDPGPGDAGLRRRDGGGAGRASACSSTCGSTPQLERVDRHGAALAGDRGRGADAADGRNPARLRAANPLLEQDESFAQILSADGSVLDTTPQLGRRARSSTPTSSCRAASGPRVLRPRRCAGNRGRRLACSRRRSSSTASR